MFIEAVVRDQSLRIMLRLHLPVVVYNGCKYYIVFCCFLVVSLMVT